VAARRLRLVADVFAASTTAFLAETVRRAPELALDLGCGPGHSTHLLATVVGARRAVGLDTSERFIATASRTATGTVSFRRHDVTTTPFPVGPADLAYCRFLLTHLADPDAALRAWAAALRPGGMLLVEEVEHIGTGNPTFASYLAVVDDVIARAGGTLYVGPRLDALRPPPTLVRRTSRVARVPVADRRAAAMFALNAASWSDDTDVRARHGDATLTALAAALRAMAEGPDEASSITWGLRQMVLERP
jgi:SAM-dependent methyltransferase